MKHKYISLHFHKLELKFEVILKEDKSKICGKGVLLDVRV
jgi:hypothetical protein